MSATEPGRSAARDVFEPISLDTLYRIPQDDIDVFRDYLRTIPFRYEDHVFSGLARQLNTEADVRTFFESSILLLVLPVVLAMMPTERDADLVMTAEKTYSGAYKIHPDISFVAYNGTRNLPVVAQIEFKGPEGLVSFRNVFQAISQRKIIEPSHAWEEVTRQLRKYASMAECSYILCSDGSDAYVFVFQSPAEVLYLDASDDDHNATLTLREAVLFLMLLGIKNSQFTLRYVYTHSCPTCRVCSCLIYCSILELC